MTDDTAPPAALRSVRAEPVEVRTELGAIFDLDRDAQRTLVRHWRHDPVAFATEALGVDLWDAQQSIARAVRDFPRVAVRSCHAAGKTFLAAVVVLWFLCTRRDALVLTTASTFRQVRYVLWRTIHRLATTAPLPLGAALTETEMRLAEQWFALGLSTDNPERFQGFHAPHVLVVVDEPGAVPKPVFAAVEGVLASGHTRLLMIGNPTQSDGPFFDAFHSQTGAYRTFRLSAFDTPNLRDGDSERPYLVTRQWVEERARMWGADSDLYRSRVLAEFPHHRINALFPLDLLDAAFADDGEEESVRPEPVEGRTASSATHCQKGQNLVNPDFPLGLHPGSVRAIIALIVLAVWAVLELGLGPGHAAPDAVRALAAAVAGGYGLMRTRSQSDLARTASPYKGEHDAS